MEIRKFVLSFSLLLLFSTNLVFSETLPEDQISSDSDDATQHNSGTVQLNEASLFINTTGDYKYGGLRFQDIAIPQGAVINSAYLSMNFVNASYDSPNHDFYCEDADDTTTFTTDANNISDRTRTTATVNWSDSNLGTGWQNTDDISSCVQETVQRDGWVSGNNLVFIIIYGGSGEGIVFYSHDWLSGSLSAKFNCTYTPQVAGDTIKGYNHGGYGVQKH